MEKYRRKYQDIRQCWGVTIPNTIKQDVSLCFRFQLRCIAFIIHNTAFYLHLPGTKHWTPHWSLSYRHHRLIMPGLPIIRVYPSSSDRVNWSMDSVCSASTVHSLPHRDANPFNPSPPTRPPPSRASDKPSPFHSGQKINYYSLDSRPSRILGSYGARYDSKGHVLHKVEIAHPMHNKPSHLATYELYERSSPNCLVVFWGQTWQRLKNWIGSWSHIPPLPLPRHSNTLLLAIRSAIPPHRLPQSWVVFYRISHRRCIVWWIWQQVPHPYCSITAAVQPASPVGDFGEFWTIFGRIGMISQHPSHHDSLFPLSPHFFSFLVLFFPLLLIPIPLMEALVPCLEAFYCCFISPLFPHLSLPFSRFVMNVAHCSRHCSAVLSHCFA